jgi:hypothetical protein
MLQPFNFIAINKEPTYVAFASDSEDASPLCHGNHRGFPDTSTMRPCSRQHAAALDKALLLSTMSSCSRKCAAALDNALLPQQLSDIAQSFLCYRNLWKDSLLPFALRNVLYLHWSIVRSTPIKPLHKL